MIDAFRRFSTIMTTGVIDTGSLILNCSGTILPRPDDRIMNRNVDMNAVDISEIPDISEMKSYEDN
jgi:hypothetical protein